MIKHKCTCAMYEHSLLKDSIEAYRKKCKELKEKIEKLLWIHNNCMEDRCNFDDVSQCLWIFSENVLALLDNSNNPLQDAMQSRHKKHSRENSYLEGGLKPYTASPTIKGFDAFDVREASNNHSQNSLSKDSISDKRETDATKLVRDNNPASAEVLIHKDKTASRPSLCPCRDKDCKQWKEYIKILNMKKVKK